MAIPTSAGRLADRYRIVRRLGSGGMATVFLADDERLGRRVAVKRLHADSPEDTARRFQREAKLGASLNHPNLVAVYDAVTVPEGVLIVMEYVDGPTLKQALADGPLPRERALEVLRGVAGALDHAHRQGIVHRDVKPANVLLGPDGQAKLADLGIATASEGTHITRTGTVLGTPSYMAPEQLEGREAGPAADVYALAVCAFEALTGTRARPGRTPLEIAHRVTSEPPPDLRRAWPEAPRAAAEALRSAMARDPAERPASAGELVAALEAALGATDGGAAAAGVPAPAPVPARRRARPAWLAPVAIAAALALLAAGVAALLSGGGGGEPDRRAGERPATEREPRPSAGGQDAGARQDGAGEGAAAGDAPRADPARTVTAFYERSAADDYDAGWALLGPGARRQLGGFEAYRAAFAPVERIEFRQADTTSRSPGAARVAIRTVATHTDKVDRCTGTAALAPGSGRGWLIDRLSVSCRASARAGGGAGAGATGGNGGDDRGGDRGRGAKKGRRGKGDGG